MCHVFFLFLEKYVGLFLILKPIFTEKNKDNEKHKKLYAFIDGNIIKQSKDSIFSRTSKLSKITWTRRR